jgi:uncharacterized protein YecT (DUF1311 family)
MRRLAAVLACLLGVSGAYGFEPQQEIKPHTAVELGALKTAAEKGDAKAELAYGKALVFLKRDAKNHVTEADLRKWFQKAADQGSGEAWYWLGYTTTDQTLVKPAYVRAAELGFAPAFDDAFDQLLFRAGENADTGKAKHLLDLAQKNGVKYAELFPGETARVINACYAAGSPSVPPADRKAADADAHAGQSFTPNDNMKYAEAYANGWGVKRNPKLALALVCHGADVPAELAAMVDTLTAIQNGAAPKEPFRFCDHVTSGMNGGQCSNFDEDAKNSDRGDALDKIAAPFTPAQKTAFDKLRAAAETYFEEHAGSEQDMSGTARDSIFADEQGRLRDQMVETMQAFEHGKLPPKDDFAKADRDLNATYRDILKNTKWDDLGTLSPDGLRSTQRQWLKLRDAWAAFAALRYPGVSADGWKAWASRQRIEELKAAFPKE